MYILIYSCLTFIATHIGFQLWENNSSYRKYFKHPGEVPQLITCSLIHTYIVPLCYYNLYNSFLKNELYIVSNNTLYMEHVLLGYFLYDLLFMIQSSSRKYYTIYIIHHILSIIMTLSLNVYKAGNNISNNLLIILLETSSPFLNISKILNYIDPKSNNSKQLFNISKKLYFYNRIILYGFWICLTPFTYNNFTFVYKYCYANLVFVYFASWKWYKKMV